MAKHIVLLSDGTGNSAGKFLKTNVWRLYQALDLSFPAPTSPPQPEQIAYYDDGVGSSSFMPFAIFGGALGWGLKRNVLDLYTFLCRTYQPGDRIYGFGFSRGAFTLRVLTGLMNSQGLVHATTEAELRRLATAAFRTYRRSYRRGAWLEPLRALRDMAVHVVHYCQRKPPYQPSSPATPKAIPPITFLGLWDTVAAYGLPIDELTRAWNWVFPLSTPERNLCANVERACHVLALDDERNTFHPVLWNEEGLAKQPQRASHMTEERLSQVWFAGMHSNVGGGYADDALANVPLDWIMGEAERAHLRFRPDERKRVQAAADVCGKLYDSRLGLGGSYRYLPRKLTTLTNDQHDPQNKVLIRRPKIHESVFTRIRRGIDGYAPLVLPAHYAVVTTQGEILDLGTPSAPGAPAFVEHPTQAQDRANQQEQVWNLVWGKRVFYFTSMVWVLLLVVFPLRWPVTPAPEGPLTSLSWVMSAVGAVLPAFTAPWLEAYQSHLDVFMVLVGLIWVWVAVGSWFQRRIFDQMRDIWRPSMQQPGAPAGRVAAVPADVLYRLRTHWLYQWCFRQMKWRVLPFAVGLVTVLALGEGVSRQLFAVGSSLGYVCTPTEPRQLTRGTLAQGAFPANAPCWATGVAMEQGKRYQLTLSLDKNTPWQDGDEITPGLAGIGPEQVKGVMSLALLLRRAVLEPWFTPIARIGIDGGDEYPLRPVHGAGRNGMAQTLVTELTARRTGELFLFVNDAVLPVPNAWQVFYRDNQGTATVSVRPVGATEGETLRTFSSAQ